MIRNAFWGIAPLAILAIVAAILIAHVGAYSGPGADGIYFTVLGHVHGFWVDPSHLTAHGAY